MRDQARPQARSRCAGSTSPRSSSSSTASTAARSASLAATVKLAREDLFGPLPARLRRRPARRPGGAARRGRRAHRGGADRADPGRGGDLPDRRRGARRRARGVRRSRGAARSSTRSRPGWGGPGSLWAYEQAAGPPRRDHEREGARRRAPGRRRRHQPRARRRPRARASTARPSPAAPVAAAAALAALEVVSDPRLLRLGRGGRRALPERARESSTALAEVRGRGLMVAVSPRTKGIDAARGCGDAGARPATSSSTFPAPGMLRFLPPLTPRRGRRSARRLPGSGARSPPRADRGGGFPPRRPRSGSSSHLLRGREHRGDRPRRPRASAGGAPILVVDDASPDGTGTVADRLAARFDDVEVLHRPGKGGLGPAYIAGFRRALEGGAALIAQMDADFSHDPGDLPRLIDAASTPTW